MGWTGEKAMAFKIRYIEAFDAMERPFALDLRKRDLALAPRHRRCVAISR